MKKINSSLLRLKRGGASEDLDLSDEFQANNDKSAECGFSVTSSTVKSDSEDSDYVPPRRIQSIKQNNRRKPGTRKLEK